MDTLFGVKFFSGTFQEAMQLILSHLDASGDPLVVFTPNTEQLMLARRDPTFLKALGQSDLNLPDSVGVVWAGYRLGVTPFAKRRIPGREMVASLVPHLKEHNKKLMLIGGRGKNASMAAGTLTRMFEVETFSHPGAAHAAAETPEETADILKKIEQKHPDIVMVAYGAPYQELWALRNKAELKKRGVKVIMVVGGTIDILAGALKAAPRLMSDFGLEWLWRLLLEPQRIRRQLALPKFVLTVLKEKRA